MLAARSHSHTSSPCSSEDIDHLDQLTDNRSDFLRHCITESWQKKEEEDVAVSLTLPKWVVREMLHFVEETLTPEETTVVQKLVKRLMSVN